MKLRIHEVGNVKMAEVSGGEACIVTPQDALNLMADADAKGARRIIATESNFSPDFFQLRTGHAGEILQKFSNYRVRLAIVGDFAKYKSNSLKAFVRESNRGDWVHFASDFEKAVSRLSERGSAFHGRAA